MLRRGGYVGAIARASLALTVRGSQEMVLGLSNIGECSDNDSLEHEHLDIK